MILPAFSVLLVSGDRALLRQLTRFLELFGYEVRQAVDAEQAQAAAEAAGADFLVVDGALAPRPGSRFCRTIRHDTLSGYTYAVLLVDAPETACLTEALEAGFDDFLAKPVVFGELLARLRTGARVIEFERRINQQVGLEPVTGLPDEGTLTATLKEHLGAAKERGKQETLGSLSLIDLDSFSRVTRRLGKGGAETLIRATGALLKQACGESHAIASLGRDRFAVFLPTATEEQAAKWSQDFLTSLSQRDLDVGPDKIRITASSGVVELFRSMSAEGALGMAGQVLALAKRSGRNCVLTSITLEHDAESWTKTAAGGN